MARPKRDQRTDLQTAIKDTALKQIAENGAAALSLRAVARELNITAPAIYNHFARRDDLVTVLINEAFTSFADALEAARDACPVDDHRERLRAISWAYYRWATVHPQRYMLIFGTPISGYKTGPETATTADRSLLILASVIDGTYQAEKIHLSPGYAKLTPGLQARYEMMCQKDWPYSTIVTHLSLAWWSMMHGLTSLNLYGYLPNFLADQVEPFIELEIDRCMRLLGLE